MDPINWEELQKKYPNNKQAIEDFESSLKKLNLLKDLREHAGIKLLIENFTNEINYINKVLMNNRDISEESRRELFLTKDKATYLVELFSGLDEQEAQLMIGVNNLQEGK